MGKRIRVNNDWIYLDSYIGVDYDSPLDFNKAYYELATKYDEVYFRNTSKGYHVLIKGNYSIEDRIRLGDDLTRAGMDIWKQDTEGTLFDSKMMFRGFHYLTVHKEQSGWKKEKHEAGKYYKEYSVYSPWKRLTYTPTPEYGLIKGHYRKGQYIKAYERGKRGRFSTVKGHYRNGKYIKKYKRHRRLK